VGKEMSNLNKHAMMEFKAAGWLNDDGEYLDEMQEAICNHVLKLLEVFDEEGHSGSTAPYTIDLFKKLAMFNPIVPLTGKDWEWTDVGDTFVERGHKLYQNKRCGHVFKDETGAYDIDGKIFWEWCERELYEDEKGYPGTEKFKSYFTGRGSRVPVTFPYTPTTVYEEYVENGDS
jgi:hypothetical protein